MVDQDALGQWLCERQLQSGGLNGSYASDKMNIKLYIS